MNVKLIIKNVNKLRCIQVWRTSLKSQAPLALLSNDFIYPNIENTCNTRSSCLNGKILINFVNDNVCMWYVSIYIFGWIVTLDTFNTSTFNSISLNISIVLSMINIFFCLFWNLTPHSKVLIFLFIHSIVNTGMIACFKLQSKRIGLSVYGVY